MKLLPVETQDSLVLVFMRAPELGRVKTRLTPSLAPTAVLGLYKCFVTDTLTTITSAGYTAVTCVHPPEAMGAAAAWLGDTYKMAPQRGRNLGQRMANAFGQAFSAGPARVLLVGTDIPDLTPDIYHQAFEALETHPAVIGPALDGGYYLIGFRNDSFLPDVFEQMPWGTARVFAKTLQVFAAKGVGVYVLPAWQDLDTYEDIVSFSLNSRGGGDITRAYLREIHPVNGLNESE